MKKEQCQKLTSMMGNLAKKIAESAVHAAVFAAVSKKVTTWMTKQEEKEKEKVRIEESATKLDESTKTGEVTSTERI